MMEIVRQEKMRIKTAMRAAFEAGIKNAFEE